jgi:hypothetical protein
MEWTEESITRLKRENNKFMHIVDSWLDNIVVGYIIEFVVVTSKYYIV